MDLLYNSGLIATDCTIESETELSVEQPAVDYISIVLGILAGIVIFYTYLLISKTTSNDRIFKSLLASTLTISFYLTFLKIFNVPVDLNMLAVEAVLVIVMSYTLSENKDSHFYIELFLLVLLGSIIFLTAGTLSQLAQETLLLAALTKICLVISGWYINKVKKI